MLDEISRAQLVKSAIVARTEQSFPNRSTFLFIKILNPLFFVMTLVVLHHACCQTFGIFAPRNIVSGKLYRKTALYVKPKRVLYWLLRHMWKHALQLLLR